jgi:hypothetical protein
MTTITALDDPAETFRTAIAAVGLPAGIDWSVKVSPRRRSMGATIEPGGAVVFAIPASAAPAQVADAVRRLRGRIAVAAADKRDRGVHIARKELVSGEGFPFAGTNHRLCLVDDSDTGRRCPCQCSRLATAHPGVPIIAERGHATWSGVRTWQLTLRRDAASARTVIEWYRTQGQAWLDEHMPALLGRLHVPADAMPTWSVRPYRQSQGYGGSWGVYRSKDHTITFNWMVFQFPEKLLRYIAGHEAAHAALRGRYGHGPGWQQVVSRVCPEWRLLDGPARTADGLTLWAGELDARHTQPATPAGPFVSGWSSVPTRPAI